jgi:hypothetical protein
MTFRFWRELLIKKSLIKYGLTILYEAQRRGIGFDEFGGVNLETS